MHDNHVVVVTHRGLEPNNSNHFSESSLEAFRNHLQRGFSIEFDFNLTSDDQVVILHDSNLARITRGVDSRAVREITAGELRAITLERGTVCFFEDLIPLLMQSPATLHALHIKGNLQDEKAIAILIGLLKKYPLLQEKLLLFDLKIETAKIVQKELPSIRMAASVAHSYDVQRFKKLVHETLYTIDYIVNYLTLFPWLWLDEWDLQDENGGSKVFYCSAVFKQLRDIGFKLALVTPELHGTSPGLLGGEKHPDSTSKDVLLSRIEQILKLQPDAVCTDYPEDVKALQEKIKSGSF